MALALPAQRFGDAWEVVSSLDRRHDLLRLDELAQHAEVLERLLRHADGDVAPRERRQERPEHQAEPAPGRHVRPTSRERAPAGADRAVADEIEDDVVALSARREVLLGVVARLIGAERADQLGVAP